MAYKENVQKTFDRLFQTTPGGGDDVVTPTPVTDTPIKQPRKINLSTTGWADLSQPTTLTEPSPKQPITPQTIVSKIEGLKQFEVPKESLWEKAQGLAISPFLGLTKAVSGYIRYVQNPVFGFLYRTDDVKREAKLRQLAGENMWLANGDAFQNAKDIPEWQKLMLQIVVDPTNLIGWGFFDKIGLKQLNFIDETFLHMSNKVFDNPAIGLAKKLKPGTRFVPPTMVRMKTAADTSFMAKKYFGEALINFTKDGTILNTGTNEAVSKLMAATVRTQDYLHADTWIQKTQSLLSTISLPKIKKTMKLPNVQMAAELTGKGADEIAVDIHSILEKFLNKSHGYQSDGEVIAALTDAYGGINAIKRSSTLEKSIGKHLEDVKSRYLRNVQEIGVMYPKQALEHIAWNSGFAQADKKVVEHMMRRSAFVSSLLNKMDVIENSFLRNTMDRYLTRPFAESNLAFAMYYAGNAAEESMRTFFATGKKEVLWGQGRMHLVDFQNAYGDVAHSALLYSQKGEYTTLVGQLGELPTGEGVAMAENMAKQQVRSYISADGIINGLSKEEIEKRISDATLKITKTEKNGVIDIGTPLGTFRIGNADKIGFEKGTSKAKWSRFTKGESFFSFHPRDLAHKEGYSLVPAGTGGSLMGRIGLDLSSKLGAMRRYAWEQIYSKQLKSLTENIAKTEAKANLDNEIAKFLSDPVLMKDPYFLANREKLGNALLSSVASKHGDVEKLFKGWTKERLDITQAQDLMNRYVAIPMPVRQEYMRVVKNGIEAGGEAPFSPVIDYMKTKGRSDSHRFILQHPARMKQNIMEIKGAMLNATFSSPADVMGALDNLTHSMSMVELTIPEMRKLTMVESKQYVSEAAKTTLWNEVDSDIDELLNSSYEAFREISDHLKTKATEFQVPAHDFIQNRIESFELTRTQWAGRDALKKEIWSHKKEMSRSQFWNYHDHEMREYWNPYLDRQVKNAAEAQASLSQLMNKPGQIIDRKPIVIRNKHGEPSIKMLAEILGGSPNDLSYQTVHSLSMLDEESFVTYVESYVNKLGKDANISGLTNKGIRRAFKKIRRDQELAIGHAGSMFSPVDAEIDNIIFELKELDIVRKLNKDTAPYLLDRAKDLQKSVAKFRTEDAVTMEAIDKARQQAAESANKLIDREFVPYHNQSYSDMFMKHICPFWNYEKMRWKWLPQHMVQYPWMSTQLGRYQKNTDKGYFNLPTLNNFMFSPLRGTIFGTVSSLTKQDYPEAYNGRFWDVMDWGNRYGFYVGTPFDLALSAYGMATSGVKEFNTLPPLYSSALNMMEAMGSTTAGKIREMVSPSRFRDFYLNEELQAKYNTRLGDIKRNIDLLEKTPNRTEEDQAQLDELKANLNNAKRNVAKHLWFTDQMGFFKFTPQEKQEASKLLKQLGSEFLGISKYKYESMMKDGENPWIVYSDKIDPELYALVRNSFPGSFIGIGDVITTRAPEAQIIKQRDTANVESEMARERRYQDRLDVWDRYLQGGMLPSKMREELATIDSEYRITMNNMYGQKKWDVVDGELKLVRYGDTPEEMYGKYGLRIDNGNYLQGIPTDFQEYMELYQYLGRTTTLGVPNLLDTLREAMFSVSPEDHTLPNGDADWDYYFKYIDSIENMVPEKDKDIWDRLKERGVSQPDLKAREYKETILKPYWDIHNQVLSSLSPASQTIINQWMYTNNQAYKNTLADTPDVKNFIKIRDEKRQTLRRLDPTLDYMLWWLGYTTTGVTGKNVPSLYALWGNTPPSFPTSTWEPTSKDRTNTQLSEAAAIRNFDWYDK